MSLSPIEFERFCASQLQLEGWSVMCTAVSGDQGADIIAESGNTRIAIQCKQYSQPVGNAAVQEAVAARIFYDADQAMVVSNASFTRSAVDLATKAAVLLLHHTKLREWGRQQVRSGPKRSLSPDDLIAALNVSGYRVAIAPNGSCSIKTPDGPRYFSSKRALIQVAERLLATRSG